MDTYRACPRILQTCVRAATCLQPRLKRDKTMAHCLKSYHPPTWAKCLKGIPKVKVQLANPGTPIHKWNLPGIPEEFTISIKRDDMTGSTLSGNKVRKLEFLMAEAISLGCKHVITCGSLQSNHCRAVAICSRQLGLVPHLILRTDIEDVDKVGSTGNVLLDRMCGARLYLAPRKAPYLTELKPRMDSIAQHIKSTAGETCYHIPVGGSNSVGVFGYISVFEEMLEQGVGEQFDDIVFACGSGGTAAGLAIANHLTGSNLRLHAVCVSDDAQYFHHHCNEMLTELELSSSGVKSEDILHIIEGHKGQGYGISTQEERDFVVDVSVNTGIILDPVYTGKAVKGLAEELKTNPDQFKGKCILYLHTGGVYGLYDGAINSTLVSRQDTNTTKLWKTADQPPF